MSVDYTVQAQGQAAIERTLFGLVARFGDLSELMDRFGTVLETSTIERFDDERAPDGSAWLPSFRARTTGGKTLTDTARLKQSIRFIASASSVQIGTNVIYARRHQEGFDGSETVAAHTRRMTQVFGLKLKEPREATVPSFSRKANTPQRAFLGLSADDREELEAQVVDYVAEVAPDVEP